MLDLPAAQSEKFT